MDKTYKPPPWVKQVWVKKDETIHPLRGVDSPSKGEVSPCLGFWFLNPSACQVCLHCIIFHVISYSCLAFCLMNHLFYPHIFSCCLEKHLQIFFWG
jgi:hypothetical protein